MAPIFGFVYSTFIDLLKVVERVKDSRLDIYKLRENLELRIK